MRKETPTTEATYEWLVSGLQATWEALGRTLEGRADESFDARTPCPGWSVRDILSHLIGIERVIQGEPWPTPIEPRPDYVHNDLGALNEAMVQQRRHLSGRVVLDEFTTVTARSLERLRGLDLEEWEREGWSPEGPRPHYRFQESRLLDSWIHLQDVRDALLEPGDDHGAGEDVVVNRLEAARPFVWGKRVGPPEGSTLRLHLTGRLARSVTLTVLEGRAVPREHAAGSADLEITTPVALFWRRGAGRIGADSFLAASATDVRGSKDLAQGFAEGLSVLP